MVPEKLDSDKLTATVVIATKNRCDDLMKALDSVVRQTYLVEIIVVADGCTDGTVDEVTGRYPSVRVVENKLSSGYIKARNDGAEIATGNIVFSIDDDAIFATQTVVEETVRQFLDPRVGAVAIPFIDVNRSPRVNQLAPFRDKLFVTSRFIGTAYAVRREVFAHCKGFRDYFVHQGEEGDFCLRMLEAGWCVALGHAMVIHHFESPIRDTQRMDFYGRRNDVLFVFLNFPTAFIVPGLFRVACRTIIYGLRVGCLLNMLRGFLAGLVFALRNRRLRSGVSLTTYRRFCRLEAKVCIPFEQLFIE